VAVFDASDVPPDSRVNRLKNRVLSATGAQGVSSIMPGTVKYLPAAGPCAWFFRTRRFRALLDGDHLARHCVKRLRPQSKTARLARSV